MNFMEGKSVAFFFWTHKNVIEARSQTVAPILWCTWSAILEGWTANREAWSKVSAYDCMKSFLFVSGEKWEGEETINSKQHR